MRGYAKQESFNLKLYPTLSDFARDFIDNYSLIEDNSVTINIPNYSLYGYIYVC